MLLWEKIIVQPFGMMPKHLEIPKRSLFLVRFPQNSFLKEVFIVFYSLLYGMKLLCQFLKSVDLNCIECQGYMKHTFEISAFKLYGINSDLRKI